MKNPPTPKCPQHKCFMQFHSGTHPYRWFYCPVCRDHWVEQGSFRGQTELGKAFR